MKKKTYQELGVNSAAHIQWISNSNNGSCRNGLVLWLSYTLEQKEKNEDANMYPQKLPITTTTCSTLYYKKN